MANGLPWHGQDLRDERWRSVDHKYLDRKTTRSKIAGSSSLGDRPDVAAHNLERDTEGEVLARRGESTVRRPPSRPHPAAQGRTRRTGSKGRRAG
jgi:hypothetical protein